jgi:hypothetical protein
VLFFLHPVFNESSLPNPHNRVQCAMPVSDWDNKLLNGEKMHRIRVQAYNAETKEVTDVEGRTLEVVKHYSDQFADFRSVEHYSSASGHLISASWYEAEATLVLPESFTKRFRSERNTDTPQA